MQKVLSCVLPHLHRQQLPHKIVQSKKLNSFSSHQKGKAIVIYFTDPKELAKTAKLLDETLYKKLGTETSPGIHGDNMLPQSRSGRIYYRNARDSEGVYVRNHLDAKALRPDEDPVYQYIKGHFPKPLSGHV